MKKTLTLIFALLFIGVFAQKKNEHLKTTFKDTIVAEKAIKVGVNNDIEGAGTFNVTIGEDNNFNSSSGNGASLVVGATNEVGATGQAVFGTIINGWGNIVDDAYAGLVSGLFNELAPSQTANQSAMSAIGFNNFVNGTGTKAFGNKLYVEGYGMTVVGNANEQISYSFSHNANTPEFIVGNGQNGASYGAPLSRSNAFEVWKNGLVEAPDLSIALIDGAGHGDNATGDRNLITREKLVDYVANNSPTSTLDEVLTAGNTSSKDIGLIDDTTGNGAVYHTGGIDASSSDSYFIENSDIVFSLEDDVFSFHFGDLAGQGIFSHPIDNASHDYTLPSNDGTIALQEFTQDYLGGYSESGTITGGDLTAIIGDPGSSSPQIILEQSSSRLLLVGTGVSSLEIFEFDNIEFQGQVNVGTLKIDVLPFASLPGSPLIGDLCTINDASSVSYRGVASGGGGNVALVMWDGTNWIYH